MGYTHYWRPQKSFTDEQWGKIKAAFRCLLKVAESEGIEIVGWDGEKESEIICDQEKIAFNGLDDDSHESFVIEKIVRSDFEFCKTAHKPYDEVVTGMLLIVNDIAPGVLEISSDGDMDGENWDQGRKIFHKTRETFERAMELANN